MNVYVDTCIYLNLWQREEQGNVQFWKLAKTFFEKCERERITIYYSGFILKELKYILTEQKFNEKRNWFIKNNIFKKVFLSETSFAEARNIERKLNYSISFYDIIHMLLARYSKATLITRDGELISATQTKNISIKKPEEL